MPGCGDVAHGRGQFRQALLRRRAEEAQRDVEAVEAHPADVLAPAAPRRADDRDAVGRPDALDERGDRSRRLGREGHGHEQPPAGLVPVGSPGAVARAGRGVARRAVAGHAADGHPIITPCVGIRPGSMSGDRLRRARGRGLPGHGVRDPRRGPPALDPGRASRARRSQSSDT